MVVSLYFGVEKAMFQMVAKWRSFQEPWPIRVWFSNDSTALRSLESCFIPIAALSFCVLLWATAIRHQSERFRDRLRPATKRSARRRLTDQAAGGFHGGWGGKGEGGANPPNFGSHFALVRILVRILTLNLWFAFWCLDPTRAARTTGTQRPAVAQGLPSQPAEAQLTERRKAKAGPKADGGLGTKRSSCLWEPYNIGEYLERRMAHVYENLIILVNTWKEEWLMFMRTL